MPKYICEVTATVRPSFDDTDNFPDCRIAIDHSGRLDVVAADDTIETTYEPHEWVSVTIEKIRS